MAGDEESAGLLSGGVNLQDRDKIAPYITEGIGTFLLVLTAALALGPFAPVSVGFMLMCQVYMGAHMSGAYFNPALVIGAVAAQKMTPQKAGGYVVAQLVGAFAAGGVVKLVFPHHQTWFPHIGLGHGSFAALAVEFLATFALNYVLMNVAHTEARKGNSFYGMAVAFIVLAGAVAGGPISGGAFNPAIGTALPAFHGAYGDIWIYWVGPVFGAAAASYTFWVTNPNEFENSSDPTTRQTVAAYVNEAVGTFFLCFTIALAADGHSVLAPLAIGSALAAMVYAGGHISGAHYNPAVTLAMVLVKRQTLPDAGLFIASQLAGGFMAGISAVALLDGEIGFPNVGATYTAGQALVVEILFTFALAHTVLNVACVESQQNNSYYGFAIGGCVTAAALAVGDVSGGAFNPAVGIALPGCKAHFEDMWIYIVGPLLGGALAAGSFYLCNPHECSTI